MGHGLVHSCADCETATPNVTLKKITLSEGFSPVKGETI